MRPNFTISYGLRFETQNQIANKVNFAPRVALSYGIGDRWKAAQDRAACRLWNFL